MKYGKLKVYAAIALLFTGGIHAQATHILETRTPVRINERKEPCSNPCFKDELVDELFVAQSEVKALKERVYDRLEQEISTGTETELQQLNNSLETILPLPRSFNRESKETLITQLKRVDFVLSHIDNTKQEATSFEDDIRVQLTKVYDKELLVDTDMKDYIMGVLYIECGDPVDSSLQEYYKAMTVMAKTYALRRGGYQLGSSVRTIHLRNGNADQGYCPVNFGCHVKFDYEGAKIPSIIPGVGVDDRNRYSHGKPVLSNAFSRNELARYYEETRGYVLVGDSGKLEGGGYDNDIQIVMQKMALAGASFIEILQAVNPHVTLTTISHEKEENQDEIQELQVQIRNQVYQKIR